MIDKELQTLIAAKDYENAIAFLMKEIEITEDETRKSKLFTNLGTIECLKGEYKTGINTYQKAMKISSEEDKYMLYFFIGNAYLETGNIKKAEENYIESVKANNHYYHSAFKLGSLYLQERQLTKAMVIYREMLKKFPKDDKLYEALGLIEQLNNNEKTSIEYYNKGLELNANSDSIKQKLASLYRQIGELEKANAIDSATKGEFKL